MLRTLQGLREGLIRMAKRFTDTGLYSKAWFRKLPPKIKCLWEWLRSNCDHAGIVEFDPELATFQIGEEIDWESLEYFGDRVEKIDVDKIWLTGFIDFQYGELKENYNPHKPVLNLIEKYGLFSRLGQPLGKSSARLMEKDKEKDKEQDKEKEKESINREKVFVDLWNNHCGTLPKVKRKLSSTRKSSLNARLREEPDLEVWIFAIQVLAASDFCTGKNDRGWVADFDYLLKPNTLAKIEEGKFQDRKNVIQLSKQDKMLKMLEEFENEDRASNN